MTDLIMLLVGLVLAIGNGLFVAAEFSIVNLDRRELEVRRSRGENGLNTIIDALKITSTHLSGAQLGITITTLLTGYTFQPAVSSLARGPLSAMGMPSSTVTGVSALIGVVLATTVSMLVGELIPKNLAISLPLPTAKGVMPFQTAFTKAFLPIINAFNNAANATVRLFGIEPKEELSGARSAEELSSLVRHSALQGSLDLDHATLLTRSLRFSDRIAVEVMTPRVKVESLEATDTVNDLIDRARKSGHSRFPVYEDSIDHVVGVAHLKHGFALPVDQWSTTPVSQIISEVAFIPETMPVENLLEEIRGHGHQIAIVIDEYGGTTGIVTLEDLAEEIVGDVMDEHDDSEEAIQRHEDRLVLDAGLRPDELLERTGIEVPDDGEYETLAGYMAATLGHIPEVGSVVELEDGELRVTEVDRATVVEIEYISDHPETDPAFETIADRIARIREEEASDE